jgi:hypothetical protein
MSRSYRTIEVISRNYDMDMELTMVWNWADYM